MDGGFRQIKLSDFRGKWVVMCFYPSDFTFVCPTELAAVAARSDELRELDVQVISFSTDSRSSHKIWNDSVLSKMIPGGLPFPMLSDAAGRIGQVYGVNDDESSVDDRARYIIDPDGVVQAIEILMPSVGRNADKHQPSIRQSQLCWTIGSVKTFRIRHRPGGFYSRGSTARAGYDYSRRLDPQIDVSSNQRCRQFDIG